MTETSQETPTRKPPGRRPALPVTIAAGMSVIEVNDGMVGTVVAITEGYCVYRVDGNDALAVAPWRDVALVNVCPAEPLLPADVAEIDRGNASAAVLRELLVLHQFGLTPTQTVAMSELVAELCGAAAK